ncbi:cation-binding protein [Aliivibrio finisterrensis]|uniref:Cation-binding protein n=1 Tax=Aliivibrio finisterrensis TaxID=511998 RepID=A0A4Q5KVA8_9GAMM|nr:MULTISPECIES: hemerythrin domain-containing protein [Aliivibrio]KAB2825675.1 cation-binding protein [Aliivibrio finisterrensis]MDD9176231.1 hemerythrin domain-containing protein [Aliivibrio sp. S3TY1]MDD9177983.1 hemerythrin domain-containing protein [Aliivibrio sp. A6]MDD9193390.1 hemerythrin domain-containing protein [Aliivibrio sp. S2TY2]RYU45597.1 cation-binding protein [Aliivibrio finisterrensis]
MLIESIYKEHGYINRIIQLLESKLSRLEDEKSVNYNVIRESVSYLSSVAEKMHHPKEDMIYQYYIDHYGEHEGLDNLLQEHHTLSDSTEAFSITIEMILNDAIVPKDIFKEHLKAFTSRVRQHLELEEKEILPFLKAHLTTNDWEELERSWIEEEDPVFGNIIDKRYLVLAEKVR